MILNGNDIKKIINEQKVIENCTQDYVSSGSIDISMSSKILKLKKKSKVIDLRKAEEVDGLYKEIEIKEKYNLKPKELILVVLNERINLPKNLVAHIRPRTSLNRLGIILSAQHINAGYKGTLNVALYNMSNNTYRIEPGMRIGQIVFETLTDGITQDLVYGYKGATYQNEEGTKGSKIYYDYVGKVVRHFKGNYYYVENVSTNTENEETLIIYRSLYKSKDSTLWSRPAKMFFEEIDEHKKGNITGQKHRFEIVEDLSHDYVNNNND